MGKQTSSAEFRNALKKARTQEDVDGVVKAAHKALTPHSFGYFLPAVTKRRRELPERGEPNG